MTHARSSFSSLTTEDQIFVAGDRNRAVCTRLKAKLEYHGITFESRIKI